MTTYFVIVARVHVQWELPPWH